MAAQDSYCPVGPGACFCDDRSRLVWAEKACVVRWLGTLAPAGARLSNGVSRVPVYPSGAAFCPVSDPPGTASRIQLKRPGNWPGHSNCGLEGNIMHLRKAIALLSALGLILLVSGVVATQRGALAQDAAAHPAHIHSGDCVNLGDVVFPLSDVSEAAMVDGTPIAGAVGGAFQMH